MRSFKKLVTRVFAPALMLVALQLFGSPATNPLQASECVRDNENLCKSNESCVKFDLIVWEYNQCTTTHEYGTLTQCKYCHY